MSPFVEYSDYEGDYNTLCRLRRWRGIIRRSVRNRHAADNGIFTPMGWNLQLTS